jgi:predicted nucleic acid-binding protein
MYLIDTSVWIDFLREKNTAIDCLIAQIAIEHDLILLHNDRDYVRIAKIVPNLKLHSLKLQ